MQTNWTGITFTARASSRLAKSASLATQHERPESSAEQGRGGHEIEVSSALQIGEAGPASRPTT